MSRSVNNPMTPEVITLKEPRPDAADAACLGGVYTDCAMSPVTNVGLYSGSVENQVFFVLNANGEWTNSPSSARSAVSIDGSIIASAIALDGTVTACALSPSDEGAELYVIKTPSAPSTDPVSAIKIFTSPLFGIRSVCFGLNGRLKTKLFVGTDEGKILSVSLARSSGGAGEMKTAASPHGGVKCVRTCPLTGNVAASFCDGFIVLFDSNGKEMESRKIVKKSMTPDSVEKFSIDWSPKVKDRLLAVAGTAVPIVLKSGVWTTTPLPDDVPSVDGPLSIIRWSLDGALLGAVTAAGVVHVYEYSPITGPELKVRALSGSNTIVSFFWGYAGEGHVVNAIGLQGVRTSIGPEDCPSVLKKALKIDLSTLLASAKEAAAGNIESGLVEEAVEEMVDAEAAEEAGDAEDGSSDSSSDSSDDDGESRAESVDESPEELREELNDLLENAGLKKADDPAAGDMVEEEAGEGDDEEVEDISDRRRGPAVSVDRQFSFQPGATVGTRAALNRKGVTRRILCWNQFGSVVRTDFPPANPSTTDPHALNEEGLIEVHLELEAAPLKQFRLKDNLHGWTMASLGGTGLALAVKSRFDITDKYEDDLLDGTTGKKKDVVDEVNGGGLSKVCFRPFTSWGNQREWIVPLPLKAEVEAVAAGNCCVAAIATDSAVRVWSTEGGFLLWSWSLRAEVPVSICANGDMFFVASAMRSRSTESLQYEIFTTPNNGGKLAIVDAGSLPISATPGTALCWTGISEDFVPFTCDTQGVMRGLYPFTNPGDEEREKFLWVPLLNFVTDYQKRGEGYWPIFVSERDVWCVPTRPEDEYEPRPAPLPPTIHVALRPQSQYVADKSDALSPECVLFLDRLVVAQTRLCARQGLPASAFKGALDGGDCEKIAKKVENAHDKKLAETFRKLLETGKLEKALGGAALAFQSMTARLMIRMAAALGMRTLESRLEELFNPTTSAAVGGFAANAEYQQPSAAATLFPQAAAAPRVEQRQQVASASSPESVDVETQPKTTAVKAAGGPVNPFAKKRKVGDENDNGNKMARNA